MNDLTQYIDDDNESYIGPPVANEIQLAQQVQRLSDLLAGIKPHIDAMPEKKRRMVPGAAWIDQALENARQVLDAQEGGMTKEDYKAMLADARNQLAIAREEKNHLATVLGGLEAEIAAKDAELAKLRLEVEQYKAICKLIDEYAPRADKTCRKPGAKLTAAARAQLKAEKHPAFTKAMFYKRP
jgi:chromosome segregation ATPase